MPLAYPSTYDITCYVGSYNKATELFDFNSYTFNDLTNGSLLSSNAWQENAVYSLNYDRNLMSAYGFSIGEESNGSSLSIPDGSTLSFEIDNVSFNSFDSVANKSFLLSSRNATPYRVYADMYFTATQQYGNTHSPTFHRQTIEVSQFMNMSDTIHSDVVFDVNFRIPIQADISSSTADRLYNINLRYIKVYAVYNFANNYVYADNFDIVPFVNDGSYILTFTSRNDGNIVSIPYITYSGGNSGIAIDTSTSAIQSSISVMQNGISSQINAVSSQISNSTNTITTKIDTMANDVKTGLQNVVASAQQNTQNIINTVTNKVEEVKTGITEVKDSIIDLPNKLEEMLTGFFVPDEDTINSKYSEFETLLSDRFGLIYQSADIIHDFAESFQTQAVMTADTGGIITMPQVTVSLAGTPFIFGGYDVDIIPDGFETLQRMCRLAVSMVCTVVFINMLKEKLEWILR